MNRLQKKCLIATAGSHLLLVVILIVGPAFFYAHPKPDDSQLLDVIPSTAIDAALSSGVKNAQPPPPAPVQPQQPPTPPTPPTPVQPQVPPTPPAPTPKPEPAPSLMDKLEKILKPEPKDLPPDDLKPVDTASPAKPKKHKPEVNKLDLTPVVRTAPKNPSHTSTDSSRAEAAARAEAYNNAVRNLQHNFKPATTVDMPGTGSVSYANYASIIRSRYTQAWEPPTDAANDEANTRVKIVVGSDGTVISAEIIQGSGDDGVDQSVQRTLDHVQFIARFPEGATEKQKTFIINFNLKAKRMLG